MLKQYISKVSTQQYLCTFRFSGQNPILQNYMNLVKEGTLIEDKNQIKAIHELEKIREAVVGSDHQWNTFQTHLKSEIQKFDQQVEEGSRINESKQKTKHMFDGMSTVGNLNQKKGMFGFLQSNEQPLWNPIKDHNMESHKKITHKFDFSKILTGQMKKHKGLYIHGAPGSGKTVLMDMFYDSIPQKNKLRIHFNEFLNDVSLQLNKLRNKQVQEPQKIVALYKSSDIRLLCFDEFQVTDIATALILKSMFEVLINNNVVVVATSNRPPDDLYKGGLQRELFMPFIPYLKENCDILTIHGRDYRQIHSGESKNYLYPNSQENIDKMMKLFAEKCGDSKAEFTPKSIEVIPGRSITVKKQNNGVAWYDFKDLILDNYGPTDYMALSKSFHTFFLVNVPTFTMENRDMLRRYILFIEELYNHNSKLYLCCEHEFTKQFELNKDAKLNDELDEAFYGHDLYDEVFAFDRCLSRVIEMQSKYYNDKESDYHQLRKYSKSD